MRVIWSGEVSAAKVAAVVAVMVLATPRAVVVVPKTESKTQIKRQLGGC